MRLIEDRRELHKLAETGSRLPETQKYIISRLSGGKCLLEYPWESAVTAYYDFGRLDTMAFRADMDALPVTEKTGCGFASKTSGAMHACGHDGHMAMLLGLADLLDEGGIVPGSNILLIFQPAEETGGGALPILERGVFEKYNVTRVFGTHLMPELPKNAICVRKGPQMAMNNELNVDITGKSLHIARHAEGIDALAAGAEFLKRLYDRVAATNIEYKILRFGKMTSGTVRNALSGHTHIEGTMRCFSENDHKILSDTLFGTAKQLDEEFGSKTEITMSEGYPPVYNDPELVEKLKSLVNFTEMPEPYMISDDFAWYQKKAPGIYVFLGTGTGTPLHSPDYVLDESVLETGVEMYKIIAENL